MMSCGAKLDPGILLLDAYDSTAVLVDLEAGYLTLAV